MKKGFYLVSLMFVIMTLLCSCNKKTQIIYDLEKNDVLINQYNDEIKINDNLAEILKNVSVQREGYKFLGWSLDGTNVIGQNQIVESKEVKVIPIFTKLKYTITYKIEGQDDIVQTSKININICKKTYFLHKKFTNLLYYKLKIG